MTDKQPEALRLADSLEFHGRLGHESEYVAAKRRVKCNAKAADELRRLHAENEALKKSCHHSGEQCAHLKSQRSELLEALRITRGNIASLGPSGAIDPFTCYLEWLAMVDAAIQKAIGGAA